MTTVAPDLMDELAALGLAEHVDRLAPFARPIVVLAPDDAAPRLGGSRMGGDPDVPDGFVWPCHRWPLAEVAGWPDFALRDVAAARAHGQVYDEGDELVMPLPFLVQLDLASVAPHDPRMPARGLLLFFAAVTTDIEDARYAKRVAAAVVHVDGALAPRPHPPTADWPPARAVPLVVRRTLTWDHPDTPFTELQRDLPPAAYATLTAGRSHVLFPGPAVECVGTMPPPGEIALLRVDEDDLAGWTVGDASWVTFVIAADDLAAHRFDRARASVYIG